MGLRGSDSPPMCVPMYHCPAYCDTCEDHQVPGVSWLAMLDREEDSKGLAGVAYPDMSGKMIALVSEVARGVC